MDFRSLLFIGSAWAAVLAPFLASAAGDAAVSRIEAFDATLVRMMKQGPALGVKGRFRLAEPAVEAAFDLPVMTRFAVGPVAWAAMSEGDRQSLIRAFSRLTAASYAHNFDRYAGEKFDTQPTSQTRGTDKIVQTRLVRSDGPPVALIYRLHESGGWKIVDVYYDGISQLTTRRSDFAAPLAAGGAKGLAAHLEALTAKQLQ